MPSSELDRMLARERTPHVSIAADQPPIKCSVNPIHPLQNIRRLQPNVYLHPWTRAYDI